MSTDIITLAEGIEVRRIMPGEEDVLSDVAIRAYSDHYLHLWYDEGRWYIARSFSPERLRRELGNLESRFYLIYVNKLAVGFFKMNIDAHTVHGVGDAVELERIYLVKAATGSGIGEAVVQFVIDTARSLGRQQVWLKAMDSSTDAIRFYRKMGFELCGTSRLDFEQMKPVYRGMVSMLKRL